MADSGPISGNVVALYIYHREWKHAVAEISNISSRSFRRRTSPDPAVVHEIHNCTHHIDSILYGVMDPLTVPLLSVLQLLKCYPNSSCHFLLLNTAMWANSMPC